MMQMSGIIRLYNKGGNLVGGSERRKEAQKDLLGRVRNSFWFTLENK